MINPGSTIGILGGGQLGRMLAMAAAQIGYHVHIFASDAESPAIEVSKYATIGEYTDSSKLKEFAKSVDVITYETENIPHNLLEVITSITPIHPSLHILEISQHRIKEKTFINSIGLGTARFQTINSVKDLEQAAKLGALPAILKTCTMGYDGKGQLVVDDSSNFDDAWSSFEPNTAILESFVHFDMEISVIVARSQNGEISCYPTVENIHKDHVLYETHAPGQVPQNICLKAQKIARLIAENLQLVGVLAVEMFVVGDDIIVNELAPRPHNSGHWTLDACVTDQFTQTIRAICGLPLGATSMLCNAVMQNLIGDDISLINKVFQNPQARVHLYGKKIVCRGRKMGHVTFLDGR